MNTPNQQQFRQAEVSEFIDRFPKEMAQLKARIPERFLKSMQEYQGPAVADPVNALRDAHAQERLVLVLGAGVSLEAGLPSWNTLLNQLMAQTLDEEGPVGSAFFAQVFSEVFRPDALMLGRYLQQFYEESGRNFGEVMRRTLYRGFDPSTLGSKALLKEIVTMCIAAGRAPNLNAIITYNYDDVLEQMLNENGLGIPFRSIYKLGDNPGHNELPIYHVHGFIPFQGVDLDLPEITFGENVYHKQYSDIYSWNNLVQINKFRETTCLFIGLSMTDPNIRRLLDIARAQRGKEASPHYIIKKRYDTDYTGQRLVRLMEENEALRKEKVSARIDVDGAADFLCDLVHAYEENDARSLGLEVIWVDDFPEIPEVLKQIRTH